MAFDKGLMYDRIAFQNAGFKGKELEEAVRGTQSAKAKGASLGLEIASFVVPVGPALRVTGRVGKAVINTLFKTQPFNPARRAILKAAGAATAVVATGGKSASVIKAILPKVAHTPSGSTGAVLRYPGHVRGTPVGDAASNWRHWRKVVNQGFPEGRLGNALHILEDATPIVIKKAMAEAVKGTTKMGKEALVRGSKWPAGKLPPPPPGYGQSFINQQMSRVNRLTSPTGRPMNPARMKSMLESWVKNTEPDFW
jgi:hypothetical protein